MLSVSIITIGALAFRAAAQTASFQNTTWGHITVGEVWPIYWTAGDGTPVSLFIGNDTWRWNIFANRDAVPGEYHWTVIAPEGIVVPGWYQLGLVQSNQLTASPLFELDLTDGGSTIVTSSFPTLTPTTNVTLIYAPAEPTMIITYWDHACGCNRTSATATNLPGTQSSWWDEARRYSKSAVVPALTVAPGSNRTAPAPTVARPNVPSPPLSTSTWAPAAATPSEFTGGTSKLICSGFGVVAFVAAAMLI